MQISKINSQNFGATPCQWTRGVLIELEKNGIDTTHIMRMMRNSFTREKVVTRYVDGNILMNMFDGLGSHKRSLIKAEDGFKIDHGTQKLLDPKGLARKLYDILNYNERTRTPEQRIWDKVNSSFGQF